MNTLKHTVIIPTAGLGSRLGKLSEDLNKSLLPYKFKPVIANIIDQFPKDTRFIIPVGYKAEQVKDFCQLVYSDRDVEFVLIDDYTSVKSGPGYTVSKCIDRIDSPFWYIPCDTYFDENITDYNFTEDVVFVKSVPENLSSMYTMFNVENNKILDITFKEKQNTTWLAFTGVMFVHDWKNFNDRLKKENSPEIIWAIEKGTKTIDLQSWQDLGNLEIYKTLTTQNQKYDFTKTDEYTFICNNKVVKWWKDHTIAKKKYEKTLFNPTVFPNNCTYKNSWLTYDFCPGTVVYENHNLAMLNDMLHWMDSNLWIHSSTDIKDTALKFYKEKTLSRIDKFLKKYPNIEEAKTINGTIVKHWQYYFDKIDWNLLIDNNLPAFIHGDLQFDNIIKTDNDFKIIDWRHEFADQIEIGDLYYDLAKLTGGLIINYSEIKENNFTFKNHDGHITLEIPYIDNHQEYIQVIEKFVKEKGWNYDKVKLLIPIIFWNMSPLHTPPFDKFLWYLAIKLFEELKYD